VGAKAVEGVGGRKWGGVSVKVMRGGRMGGRRRGGMWRGGVGKGRVGGGGLGNRGARGERGWRRREER